MSRQLIGIPRAQERKEILCDIELLDEAIADDIFYTRDPNDAATLMCYGFKIMKVQVARVTFGNRKPQKVVLFGFDGHNKTYKTVMRIKLNLRPSIEDPNINIAQFKIYMEILKTAIHSYI